MLAGLSQSLISMLFRAEQFAIVAKVRVGQAVVTTGLSLALSVFWLPTGTALIASTITGQFVGVAALVSLRDRRRPFVTGLRWSLIARCGVRFRRFPKYTAPSDLLNVLGANLPMLFIGTTYGVAAAGAYALAQRTLGTPLMLIGSAFSDAYRQSAAKCLATEGHYWTVAVQTMRTLTLIAVIPTVICLAFASQLFQLVFGTQWSLTGELVQILALAYFFRLVVSPLSYNYYLANRHSEDLASQCLSFVATVVLFTYAQAGSLPLKAALLTYAGILCSVYILYGTRSMQFAKMSLNARLHPAIARDLQ